MCVAFSVLNLGQSQGNGHRHKNALQGWERATHPHIISFHFSVSWGRSNGRPRRIIKLSVHTLLILQTGSHWLSSGAGQRRGNVEKRNRKQMGDVISPSSPNSEKPQTSLVAWRLGQKWDLCLYQREASRSRHNRESCHMDPKSNRLQFIMPRGSEEAPPLWVNFSHGVGRSLTPLHPSFMLTTETSVIMCFGVKNTSLFTKN